MEEFVGKSCKIHIFIRGENLFFTVKRVLSVTDTHISFVDKFDEAYSFRKVDVVEINNT